MTTIKPGFLETGSHVRYKAQQFDDKYDNSHVFVALRCFSIM